MPELSGVIETCLHADDLEGTARFYEEQLGLRKLGGDDRFCVFSVPIGGSCCCSSAAPPPRRFRRPAG